MPSTTWCRQPPAQERGQARHGARRLVDMVCAMRRTVLSRAVSSVMSRLASHDGAGGAVKNVKPDLAVLPTLAITATTANTRE